MTDRHEHLDEGTIHAWLDGALSPDESARVDAATNTCAECAALVAEARGLIAASSRILSSLDTVPAGVIPGSSGNVDQLAALRARHSQKKRTWWNDRRIVAAASIMFVAGVSTMVWRSAPDSAKSPLAEQAADAVQPLPDSVDRMATAPAASDAASLTREAPAREAPAREAPARDDRIEATARRAAPSPVPVAPAADSAAERKVAASTALAGKAAANEVKLADSGLADRTRQAASRRELARTDQVAPMQQQLRQQGTVGQLQGFQQLRPDTIPVNAPPPSFGARARIAPAVPGAAAVTSCYRLYTGTPTTDAERRAENPDRVELLPQQVPVLSDPAWYRTRTYGPVRDTTLAWRSIDSITVELRSRLGADSTGMRFLTTGALPNVLGLRDVRPAIAVKSACP